jgi:aryl-alcohol dehydrogenase-like predicted oxidoreductase
MMSFFADKFVIGGLHFGGSIPLKEVIEIIAVASAYNINGFEVAPIYGDGNCEETLSTAIAATNINNVKIFAKYGMNITKSGDYITVDSIKLNAQIMDVAVSRSKRIFQQNLYSVQIHAPNSLSKYVDILDLFETYLYKKDINEWGISNFDKHETLEIFSAIRRRTSLLDSMSFQFHFNIFEQRALDELLPYINPDKIRLLINRALCRGILSSKYYGATDPPNGSRGASSVRVSGFFRKYQTEFIESLNKLQTIADCLEVSVEHLAIKYCLEACGINSKILLGVRNSAQLESLLKNYVRIQDMKIKTIIDTELDKMPISRISKTLPITFFEK